MGGERERVNQYYESSTDMPMNLQIKIKIFREGKIFCFYLVETCISKSQTSATYRLPRQIRASDYFSSSIVCPLLLDIDYHILQFFLVSYVNHLPFCS